jgi:hypothetical protein
MSHVLSNCFNFSNLQSTNPFSHLVHILRSQQVVLSYRIHFKDTRLVRNFMNLAHIEGNRNTFRRLGFFIRKAEQIIARNNEVSLLPFGEQTWQKESYPGSIPLHQGSMEWLWLQSQQLSGTDSKLSLLGLNIEHEGLTLGVVLVFILAVVLLTHTAAIVVCG